MFWLSRGVDSGQTFESVTPNSALTRASRCSRPVPSHRHILSITTTLAAQEDALPFDVVTVIDIVDTVLCDIYVYVDWVIQACLAHGAMGANRVCTYPPRRGARIALIDRTSSHLTYTCSRSCRSNSMAQRFTVHKPHSYFVVLSAQRTKNVMSCIVSFQRKL